jgi:DNA mismatch repair protein MutH
MAVVLRNVTPRLIRVGGLCLGLASLVLPALSQTNLDADAVPADNLHNLSPLAGFLRLALWSFAGVVVIIAAVMTALRYRGATNLYKLSSDEQWKDDSVEAAGERFEASDVDEACEGIESMTQPTDAAKAAAEAKPSPQARLFTPASGVAWGESMLKAFLSTCMGVNCLGRTWRESAARRAQSPNLPDPREAELIRRLMQRWQEFHVDPEMGVFFDRPSGTGMSRVCVIRVSKDKRKVIEAAFNAGFVIESVGRYLKSTDLVSRRGLGDYHAPTKEELAAMTPGEKQSLMRITEIPDPWQAMIAGPSVSVSR